MTRAGHTRRKGAFITLEGVEGCGKTTQLRLLAAHLAERGFDVVATREPGGTPLAERIRDILLDPAHTDLCPAAELLLYGAARAQHVAEKIRPALAAGRVVVCDRFADSTTVYQGAGRGLAPDVVVACHRLASGGVWPDLTVVIDVPAATGLSRVRQQRDTDRMEQEALTFHERVRAGFLALAREEPDRVKVVDGTRPVEAVAAEIAALADAAVGRP